jgi:undecaprenyl-diphosphatase
MIKALNNKKLFIFILTLISLGFVFGDSVYQLDSEVDNYIYSIRTTGGLDLFSYIAFLGDKYFIVLLAILLSYLVYRYWTKDSFLLKVFWVAFGMNMLSGFATKYFVGRDRPLGAEIYEGFTYSFPSGHSLASFFMYGFIAFFFFNMRSVSKKIRYVAAGVSFLIIILVGISRLYLGVHYLSDVVGGYLFGLFWLNFAVSFFREISLEENSSSVRVS